MVDDKNLENAETEKSLELDIDKNEELPEKESSNVVEQTEEKKKETKKLKKSDKIFFAVTSTLIVILSVYLLLFSFVFFHVAVSGRSMNETLTNGDILIVNKLKTPQLGDVIIISDMKDNGDWLIKRVIGVEGDVITIKDGEVYRNGELLVEDYIKGKTYAPDCLDPNDIAETSYVVGEGEIFFLGDNREDSLDSRHYGNCKFSSIEGVVPEFSIKIKGVTTSVNTFFIKVKLFFGIKSNIRKG